MEGLQEIGHVKLLRHEGIAEGAIVYLCIWPEAMLAKVEVRNHIVGRSGLFLADLICCSIFEGLTGHLARTGDGDDFGGVGEHALADGIAKIDLELVRWRSFR